MKESNMRDLAFKWHKGAERKGPGHVPYITHPQAVVERLRKWGVEDDETLAIAWGHDLLEDTAVTEDEILACGGQRVLDGIKALTHRKGEDKSAYISNLASSAPYAVLLIKCADRICNAEDFRRIGMSDYADEYLEKGKPLFEAALGVTVY